MLTSRCVQLRFFGSSRDLASEFQKKGWRRPLLVTDQRLMQLQLPKDLIRDLERTRVHCPEFDGLPENFSLMSVEAGLCSYRASGLDALTHAVES